MVSFFTSLQGATLILGHATLTKVLISFSLRTPQFLKVDTKTIENNPYYKEFLKAQKNESEYAALLTAVLLYLASIRNDATEAATLAVIGQIGYVWVRTAVGYPKLPSITFALLRYGALMLCTAELYKVAF
jgi:hypothetical protein